MSRSEFTAADFAQWNLTASVFRLPKRLIAGDDVARLRLALIQTIGADKLAAVQALPDHKFRLEFTSAAHKAHFDRNGLYFRGVNITPSPAYERIVRVLVDRAPLPLSDDHFISALSPYGRVVSVKSLTVRGFPFICSGTRMVSMSVLKPIPPELTIASFPCSVRYQGQPKFFFRCRYFGHFGNSCPT